jgi:hypothetical protein
MASSCPLLHLRATGSGPVAAFQDTRTWIRTLIFPAAISPHQIREPTTAMPPVADQDALGTSKGKGEGQRDARVDVVSGAKPPSQSISPHLTQTQGP